MRIESVRRSPVRGRLESLGARFEVRNGMAVAVSIGEQERVRAEIAGIADLSFLQKSGIKGPHAAGWLKDLMGDVPLANCWVKTADGSTVARLGNNEFFVEDEAQPALCAQVSAAMRQSVDGVYTVYRNDASFALIGKRANELLVEVCSFNFRELPDAGVVMTSMAGVSVVVLRRDFESRECYRIWCDPTMAAYLWDTLSEIALELGGGPVGVDMVFSAKPSV